MKFIRAADVFHPRNPLVCSLEHVRNEAAGVVRAFAAIADVFACDTSPQFRIGAGIVRGAALATHFIHGKVRWPEFDSNPQLPDFFQFAGIAALGSDKTGAGRTIVSADSDEILLIMHRFNIPKKDVGFNAVREKKLDFI